ncbi:cyclic GMP-AMP synthase DncV-like nucleotidyltransferase [Phenylobacterium sp.]|uniref:SMODS domain-containing nucleotidyltransferase n=1 Tax=Phenylobacterium sp. TaxID=1871053 RepID=UPI0035B38C64
MKLKDHFDTFLTEVVNLNATRVSQLEDSVGALKDVMRASGWTPRIRSFGAQGSWAHKTIIKPLKDQPFDADLLVYVDPVEGWEAKTYLSELRAVFANHGTYKDKVRRFSHCVTIEYAGERKIDIAPVVVNRGSLTCEEVCNFNTNAFELTAPGPYTQWLLDRNSWTGGNGLRKVTRLLKYLRDIKTTFTCPSVLLTTLLGLQITQADAQNTTDFADVPTALKTIVGRLDDWLQARPTRPIVTNPVLASETLCDAWDATKYANFRERIHTYRDWIDDAYAEADRDESIGKWRRVFGDDFAASVVVEKAAAISDSALATLNQTASLPASSGAMDLVSLFARLGRRALPGGFDRLPHKQRPKWRAAASGQLSVFVEATLHDRRNGIWLDTVAPDRTAPLPKHRWLQFKAKARNGVTFAGEYEVHWRVTNTDREAQKAGCLRGEFVKANDGSSHWEQLEYRGVHSVEAFVVRSRDKALVAQSDPFYVVIQ